MRKSERFNPKVRICLTIDEGVLETSKRRAKEGNYKSFSQYVEEKLKSGGVKR